MSSSISTRRARIAATLTTSLVAAAALTPGAALAQRNTVGKTHRAGRILVGGKTHASGRLLVAGKTHRAGRILLAGKTHIVSLPGVKTH